MLRLLTMQVRTDTKRLREMEQERRAAERTVGQLRREWDRVKEEIRAAEARLRDTQAEVRSVGRSVEGAECELRTLQAKVGELGTWQANLGKGETALQQAAHAVQDRSGNWPVCESK